MGDPITDRAAVEADEILAQFERLEALGAYVNEPVSKQKRVFLQLCLIQFARREKLLHASAEEA